MYTRMLVTSVAFSCVALAQFRSPQVAEDRRVTFRLRAPSAKQVQLQCEGVGIVEMQKDADGNWSFTTAPLAADLYAYCFIVDGLRMLDPANPLLKYNLFNTENLLHVPGQGLPWEVNDVPHGLLHRHLYRSAIMGDHYPFLVYTPAGYNPSGNQRYPVLYLLHGFSDVEDSWVSVGRANIILDNLIASGKARPMVVVMPLGYGNRQIMEGGWQGLRNTGIWQDSIKRFGQILLTEVMPQVEKAYHVCTDPQGRAIAGLSMGGSQSLLVGLSNLDRFAWIGAFSSGGLRQDLQEQFPKLDQSANERIRLLWIACGKQDGLLGANQALTEFLRSKDIKHQWIQTDGGHSFTVWRRNLSELAQLLFK